VSATQAQVDELIDRWQAAWSNRDPDAFAELCAANVHYEDPLTPEPLEGAVALGRHALRLWAAIPDARIERTGARLTDGTFVAAPCRLLGTHRAKLGPLPATGRFVIVHGVFFGELERARLKRVRAFFDVYAVARELGVLPGAGTIGERALLALRGFGVRKEG
jgi:steroid delta-isomerase-like uncharacterized protein